MRAPTLERYLLRDVAQSWLGVTVVLLAILLATRFARFLGRAASGALPQDLLFQVAALSSLKDLIVLAPVSLLLAVMMSLGRLYRDQEVTALLACGAPLATLYRPAVVLALGIATLTAALAFEIGPWAARTAERLVAEAARTNRYNPFEAGRFKPIPGTEAVLYTGTISEDGERIETFFAVQPEGEGRESVVVAKGGASLADRETGERVIRLEAGHRYEGAAGQGDFDVLAFESLTLRIPPPEFAELRNRRKHLPTTELMRSAALEDKAEVAFRLALPVSVFVLVLLAVPLSHVKPRSGRYGQIVVGVVLYLVYSQLITLGQLWIGRGQVPPWIGLWWVHGLFLGLALFWIRRQAGQLR